MFQLLFGGVFLKDSACTHRVRSLRTLYFLKFSHPAPHALPQQNMYGKES